MNILVLCTGNSARSILLEALLNASPTITAFSAGSQPTGRVNPHALTLLQAKGFETAQMRSKSWDEFGADGAPVMDAVITVCGSAAEEQCPLWPGAPITAHWGVEDPAAATESEAPAAFEEAYAILKARADAFLAADVIDMDGAALRAHLLACGSLS